MNQEIMNRMADEIERALADQRAPCRVVTGALLPGWVQFNLKPLGSTRFDAVARLRNDLALALGARHVRVGREIGYITLQIADGVPQVRVDDLLNDQRVKAHEPMVIPIGIGESGEPVLLRIGNNTSNTLIAGTMGTGKTTLAHAMLIALAARNPRRALRLIICDPKRHDISWMLNHIDKNIEAIHQERDQVAAAIADVATRVGQARGYERETVLFIDELVWSLGADTQTADHLKIILTRGREFGYRVIACEPIPGTAPLAGALLDAFPVRITGRQSSAASAYNATGIPASGAELLTGEGDMLIVHFGQATRFRAVMPPKTFTGQKIAGELAAIAPTPAPVPTPAAAPTTPAEDPDALMDFAVLEQLYVSAGGAIPGVTAWANARFIGQWERPYAGDRIKWMRERYAAAVAKLAKPLSPPSPQAHGTENTGLAGLSDLSSLSNLSAA